MALELAVLDPEGSPAAADQEPLGAIAEWHRQNERRYDPLSFEHSDPWLIEEAPRPSEVVEQRVQELEGLRWQNREQLEDTSSRLRCAIASARRHREGSRPAAAHGAYSGGSTSSSSRPARPGSAPPGSSARPHSGRLRQEDAAEYHRRASENRARANNWIAETCPGYDVGSARPWIIEHPAVARDRVIHAKVMKNSSCPFHAWLQQKYSDKRNKSLRARMRTAGLVGGLRSESKEAMVRGIKSLFENEAKDRVSKERSETEELAKTSRAAAQKAAKTKGEEEILAAIRLAQSTGVGDAEDQTARRTHQPVRPLQGKRQSAHSARAYV